MFKGTVNDCHKKNRNLILNFLQDWCGYAFTGTEGLHKSDISSGVVGVMKNESHLGF